MRRTAALSRLQAASAAAQPTVPEPPVLRSIVDVLFRYRWMLLGLLGLFTVVLGAYLALSPRLWESEMTILVRDAAANSEPPEAAGASPLVASEIELLRSDDLAGKVVEAAQLAGATAGSRARAIAVFKKDLQVAPLAKSNLIRLRYSSIAPARSARVLELLAKAYQEQRQQIAANPSAVAFFDKQTSDADRQLANARESLLRFHQRTGVADASAEKGLYLKKMVDLQTEMQSAETEHAETVRKADELKARLDQVPSRISASTTQRANQYSVERLTVLLAELRNRRTELQAGHAPPDALDQVEQQIAQTTSTLKTAEATSASDETTGANPTRQSIEKELEHAQAAAAGIAERMLELRAQKDNVQRELARLEPLVPAEQDFLRDETAAEEKYMLYSKSREESRIGERANQEKVVSGVVIDAPRVPLAAKARLTPGILGAYLITWPLTLLLIFIRNQWHRSAFTPWALDAMASVPVLGTVPASFRDKNIGRNV